MPSIADSAACQAHLTQLSMELFVLDVGKFTTDPPVHEPLVLRNWRTDLLLGIQDGRLALNKQVRLWDDPSNKNNHWQLRPVQSTNYLHICPENDERLCLGLAEYPLDRNIASRGAALVAHNHWSAKWIFRTAKDGAYRIANAWQGFADGQWQCDSRVLAAQPWPSLPAESGNSVPPQPFQLGTTVAADFPSASPAILRFEEWLIEKPE